MWQEHIILHDVTRHFAELPQVPLHAIDQYLAICVFGSDEKVGSAVFRCSLYLSKIICKISRVET